MLNIYKTNRIELITDVLAQELLINPPFITENLSISIQNHFLGKWMRDQITLKNGISALYEFQSLTSFTEELINNIYKKQKPKSWNYESIKWSIVESFEALGEFKESWPLMNWINKFKENYKILDSEIYTLSGKIAKVYCDYILYRPEIIEKWHVTDLKSQSLFLGLNEDQYWQPILYKLVAKKLNKPACLYMKEIANNKINFKENLEIILPKNIYIIATNSLSKLQISFYFKLSEFSNVKIYFLSPGYDLWNRINIDEGEVDLNNRINKQPILKESIEKIFGRFIANFEKLIEETIFNEERKVNIQLPYIDPTINLKANSKASLLNQIQKNLVNNNKHQNFEINKNDNSLIFRGCKNILEELAYIKEKILNICSSDPNIKYSDILITSNQINNIKPYLKYIFNLDEKIPYFLSFEDYKDISPIYNLLRLFIEISNKKITPFDIKQLLSEITLQTIFNFNNKEKDEIISHLIDSGFHWGIDSKERHGEYKNSLDWCIKRFTLGLIYGDDFYLKEKELKPYSSNNSSIDINKWIIILTNIKNIIERIRNFKSFENWILIFKDILSDFKTHNDTLNEDINNLNRLLEEISKNIDSDTNIELNVLNEILNTYLNNQKANLDKRKNEVLISDIASSRYLPHKVTFVMGMNQISYPRVINRDSINILNNEHRFGDPSFIDKEKYLFLELLISCREQFIISWSNYDSENNNLEISSPISQLIKVIKSQVDITHHNNLIKEINNKKDSYNGINKSNCKQEGLIRSLKFENKNIENKEYKLSELINWYRSPQLHWLKQRNIFPKKNFIYNPSDERISNYQKYKLFTNLLRDLNIDDENLKIKLSNLKIKEKLISNGIISPKNSIHINELEVDKLIQSLIYNFTDLDNIQREYQKSESNKVEYFKNKNMIIELIHSNINFEKRGEIWIKLLFISSLDKDINKAQIIYRKNDFYNLEILNAPCKSDAIRLIDQYLNIYHNSLEYCLPLPPESSYKYIFSFMKNKNHEKAFIDEWIGNKNFNLGERDKPEMQLCYGYEKDPNFFLNDKYFQELSIQLYKPLVASLL